MNRMSRSVFIILLIINIYALAAAEDTSVPDRKDLPIFDLGCIEVVGKIDPPETTAVEIITAQDIDKSMHEDLSEAIRQVPGITTTTGSKNEAQFMIRGLYQERVLVLMDGIPVAAPYYGDLDSAEIPLDNLQEIKIIRGNASVLFGPNTMGGVVSMVSPKPGLKPNLNLYTSVDEEGNFVGRFGHGRRFGKYYYQLSAGVRESDGWSLSSDFEPVNDDDGNMLEDGDIRENSQFSQWSGSLKLGAEWLDKEISIATSFTDSEKGIPPSVDPEARIRYRKFPEWKKSTFTIAGRKSFGDNLEFRTNVFYHKYDNAIQDFSDATHSRLRWESTYDDYSTGLNSRISWNLNDSWTLRSAVHAIQDNHKAQSDLDEPWQKYKANTYSLAVQSDWQASSVFSVQLGTSYDIYNFDSVSNIEGNSETIADRTQDASDFTGSVIGKYDLTDSQIITMAVSRKLQLPTMHQLFSNIEEFDPINIPSLDPETAMEYSVGYEFESASDYQLGMTAFYYDISDMIVRPDRDDLYINLDSAAMNGFEFWASYNPVSGFSASISYSYTDAEEKSTIYGKRPMEYVPDNTVRIDTGYKFNCGTSIHLGMNWQDEVNEYDKEDASVVPDYTLLNAFIRHEFDFGLSLSLKMSNLTDENYYQEKGFPQAGRNFLLGVTFSI